MGWGQYNKNLVDSNVDMILDVTLDMILDLTLDIILGMTDFDSFVDSHKGYSSHRVVGHNVDCCTGGQSYKDLLCNLHSGIDLGCMGSTVVDTAFEATIVGPIVAVVVPSRVDSFHMYISHIAVGKN